MDPEPSTSQQALVAVVAKAKLQYYMIARRHPQNTATANLPKVHAWTADLTGWIPGFYGEPDAGGDGERPLLEGHFIKQQVYDAVKKSGALVSPETTRGVIPASFM